MASQSQANSSQTCVSLVVRMAATEAQSPATVAVITEIQRLQLPTTWIVDQPRQAKLLASKLHGFELAATVAARSPQRLRSELSNLQAGLQAVAGQQVSVVAGDPQQLRSRASLLADLGVSAIVSDLESSDSNKPPRQLPCGLWQMDSSLVLPRVRGRWSFLPNRRPSLSQLLGADGTSQPRIAALDLGQASARDVQGFTSLLQELAQATRQQRVTVEPVSKLAAQLTSQHEVKPQRSILRRAA